VAAVIEVPQLESWFLVDWPATGSPAVMMEFDSKSEADAALRAAVGDSAGADGLAFSLTVRSALAMLEDPGLRAALAAWDLEFAEA
jgi:hypothetical protein